MELTRARTLLEDELEQLDADADTEVRDRDDQGAPDRRQGVDFGDAGSQATEAMDRDLTLGTLRERRDQVVAALGRIDAGTYGRCAVCGREIDDERLEARPVTERCREHPEGPDEVRSVES